MLIPVFYTPQMNAFAQSFSPSARKPAEVISAWKHMKLPIDVHEFEPATSEMLKRVHHPDYVDGILSCLLKNGFGNRFPEMVASLPALGVHPLRNPPAPAGQRLVRAMPPRSYDYQFQRDHQGWQLAAGWQMC